MSMPAEALHEPRLGRVAPRLLEPQHELAQLVLYRLVKGFRHGRAHNAAFANREFWLDTAFAISEYTRMELMFGKQAAKKLGRMQPKVASAIRKALATIAADPFAQHANVKPLEGVKDGFRLRHGDWRVLYRLDREAQKMLVEFVKPRGDAFK